MRKYWLWSALLCCLILLSACNTEKNDDNTKSKDSDTADTKIIKTVHGDIEIPSQPKRIVAQGYLGAMLALDVKPLGAPIWDIESPHIQHLTDGIEDIGTIEASSVEKIIALKPDLIVTLAYDDKLYEQLSKIAPTIVYTADTFMDTRDEIRTFGDILGKEEQAEQWIKDFDQLVADSKAKLAPIIKPDDTFTVMGGFDKVIYIYASGIWRGSQAIYEHLELTPPPAIKEIMDKGKAIEEISAEVIPDYVGDYLFLDGGDLPQLNRDTAMWESLTAEQKQQVFDLDGDYFWPFDPIAIKAQVEKVTEMIIERYEENNG